MKTAKILILAGFLGALTSASFGQGLGKTAKSWEASGAITIDGIANEADWAAATAYDINFLAAGVADPGDTPGATFKSLWDATNLYVLVERFDDVPGVNDSGNAYHNDDAFEIFSDGDSSGGATYDGVNDYQSQFRIADNAKKDTTKDWPNSNHTAVITGNNYILEVAVPWTDVLAGTALVPAAGFTFGFDVSSDDDDGGGGGNRETLMTWNDDQNLAWQQPQQFGTLELTAVPEPATVSAIFGIASLLVCFYFRRRNK